MQNVNLAAVYNKVLKNLNNGNCYKLVLQKIAQTLFDIHTKAALCPAATGKLKAGAIFVCYNNLVKSATTLFEDIEQEILSLKCNSPGFTSIQNIYKKLPGVAFVKKYLSVRALGNADIQDLPPMKN